MPAKLVSSTGTEMLSSNLRFSCLGEHADAAPGHAVEQRGGNLGRALHGVVLAADPRLEPFEWTAMLGGHADQEVRIGADAAVGEVIVGEHDQDIGLGRGDRAGEIAIGGGDDVLDVGGCGFEQADQARRMRRAGREHDLCHFCSPVAFQSWSVVPRVSIFQKIRFRLDRRGQAINTRRAAAT